MGPALLVVESQGMVLLGKVTASSAANQATGPPTVQIAVLNPLPELVRRKAGRTATASSAANRDIGRRIAPARCPVLVLDAAEAARAGAKPTANASSAVSRVTGQVIVPEEALVEDVEAALVVPVGLQLVANPSAAPPAARQAASEEQSARASLEQLDRKSVV